MLQNIVLYDMAVLLMSECVQQLANFKCIFVIAETLLTLYLCSSLLCSCSFFASIMIISSSSSLLFTTHSFPTTAMARATSSRVPADLTPEGNLRMLSMIEIPDVMTWQSTGLGNFVFDKHHIRNLPLVLYWLRQELVHIKAKASFLGIYGTESHFRILDIDRVLVRHAIVDADHQSAVDHYIEEYAIYRFEEGVAPPPEGMNLPMLRAWQSARIGREVELTSFLVSLGMYLSIPNSPAAN